MCGSSRSRCGSIFCWPLWMRPVWPLTKAPMLDSRYFLVCVPVINIAMMTVAHALLKQMLVRTRYTRSIQSLVGW